MKQIEATRTASMRMLPAWRLCVVGLLALAACGGHSIRSVPTTGQAADAAAVRSARLAQNEAIVAQNPDAVASFWTDDVVIRRGLGPLVVGRDAYRQLFTADPGTIYTRVPAAVEVSSQWPFAFETGEWTGRVGSATGPAVIGGRYSAQWVKRDGRWLIRAEVFVALTCDGVGCTWPFAP